MRTPNGSRKLFVAIAGLCLLGCESAQHDNGDNQIATAVSAASVQRAPDLSDLTAGDLGLGGGYLIGAAPAKFDSKLRGDAVAASRAAEQSPATAEEVRTADNADLNHDGYITLDEVLAMVRAGLSEKEMSSRLQNTGYIFHVTPEQERYLSDRGVEPQVISMLSHFSGLTKPAVVAREQ